MRINMSRELIFLDGSGHTVIRWNEASDTKMRAAIDGLMQKGHAFFVVEYANNGAVQVEHAINNPNELTERSVVVSDDSLKALYDQGALRVGNGLWGAVSSMVRRLKTPAEILEFATAPSEPSRRYGMAGISPRGGG
jgi:hypothetical protein